MTGTETAAYGMYSRNAALSEIVYSLNRAGFDKEDICMVLSPAHPVATAVCDATIRSEKEERAMSARLIGWFSEFGAVVIPTVGFFIRSQAFFRALVVEQKCPSLSRGSHTLVGLGFSEPEAKRLGHELSDVGALVYVSCRELDKTNSAIELLRRAGAKEAASLGTANSGAATLEMAAGAAAAAA
jgi:hypothetical protein